MKYAHIRIGSDDSEYDYWISGVYKIVLYNPGEYYAYYIPDGWLNWGQHVAKPADKVPCTGCGAAYCPGWHNAYRTIKRAKAAITRHAAQHDPAPHTVKRAAEILAALIEEHYAAPADLAELDGCDSCADGCTCTA